MRFAPHLLLLFNLLVVTALSAVTAWPVIRAYPRPACDVKSTVFTVRSGGQELGAISYKDIHYVHFEWLKPATITIEVAGVIATYEVQPARGCTVKRVGNRLEMYCAGPGYWVIKVNGAQSLFVFAEKQMDTAVTAGGKDVVNVLDYRIDNTGNTTNTLQLQQALDDIAQQKKILFFPAGIYRTGSLTIGSNARVFLAPGAVIKGSENPSDYPVDAGAVEPENKNDLHGKDNGEVMTFSRLILISDARNVRIWGRGIIDGSGAILRRLGKPANLVRIRRSSDVSIEGLVLRDPAAWNTHILYSEHISITDVKIINDRDIRNTDGIDPDASRHVQIRHCFAYCSDDNIAVKSSNNSQLLRDVEDVLVERCIFLTKKSALKIGTETKSAAITHVVFKDNEVIEADRGIALYCYDGAVLSHIQFTGNHFIHGFPDSKQKAIHFEIRDRSGKGMIRDVLIKDCRFEPGFHATSRFTGLDSTHAIKQVTFENVTLHGKICQNAQDLQLRVNAFAAAVIFKK